MADAFDALLLRLIAQLDPNTPEARLDLYSKATKLLEEKLNQQQPALNADELRAEQSKLQAAIDRVEAQYSAAHARTGSVSSLPPSMKAAIIIPTVLLILLVGAGGYFFLSGRTPASGSLVGSASSPPSAPQPKSLDRTEALKIIAGSSPATKTLPLGLQIALLKSDNTWWHPSIEQTTEMMQEDERSFLTELGGFEKVSFANMVGTIAKPLWSLRAYWGSGVVENIKQSAQPNWIIISLKPQFRPSCLRDAAQGSPAAAPDVPAACAAVVAMRSVKAVTGILGDEKSAVVEYVVEQQPTDFGNRLRVVFQSFDQYDQVPELNPRTEQFVAQLLRYDDGWRVQHVEKKQ
jgi:hypothetical protein